MPFVVGLDGAVAGFKVDGNVDGSAGLKDFALQAFRRNRAGAGSADGGLFECVWATVDEAEVGNASFVLLKGAEVVFLRFKDDGNAQVYGETSVFAKSSRGQRRGWRR